ncbi:MAG: hypothetical protein DMD26_15300 [Gemmatimonadetes bacterium]|nr:MAG: hypothetical protein DMD26_15300 [Gemmatimonadota bacterium]
MDLQQHREPAVRRRTDFLLLSRGTSPVLFVHGWNANSTTWTTMVGRFKADGYTDAELVNWSYNSAATFDTFGNAASSLSCRPSGDVGLPIQMIPRRYVAALSEADSRVPHLGSQPNPSANLEDRRGAGRP